MKRTQQTVNENRPVKPAPKPIDPRVIEGLADQVERGRTVAADLSDGSFVALMEELGRRGLGPIARSEAEKQLNPFMVRVAKGVGNGE